MRQWRSYGPTGGPFKTSQRRVWWGGGLYVIRDVRQSGRHVRCEYAVPNKTSGKKWLPCNEGVEFRAIQPLRVRASKKFRDWRA